MSTMDLQGAVMDLAEVRAQVAEAIRLKGQSGGKIAKAAAEIASGRFVALHGDILQQVMEAVLAAAAPVDGRLSRKGDTLRALAH